MTVTNPGGTGSLHYCVLGQYYWYWLLQSLHVPDTCWLVPHGKCTGTFTPTKCVCVGHCEEQFLHCSRGGVDFVGRSALIVTRVWLSASRSEVARCAGDRARAHPRKLTCARWRIDLLLCRLALPPSPPPPSHLLVLTLRAGTVPLTRLPTLCWQRSHGAHVPEDTAT